MRLTPKGWDQTRTEPPGDAYHGRAQRPSAGSPPAESSVCPGVPGWEAALSWAGQGSIRKE